MRANNIDLTISGGLIGVDRELKLGDTVVLIVHGAVIEEKKIDNQDGTYDYLARVKGEIAEVRSQEGMVISSKEDNGTDNL